MDSVYKAISADDSVAFLHSLCRSTGDKLAVGTLLYSCARADATRCFLALLDAEEPTMKQLVVEGFSFEPQALIQRLLFDGLEDYVLRLIRYMPHLAQREEPFLNGKLLVHEVAYGGHIRVFREIEERFPGHALEARCVKGGTALHWALKGGQSELALCTLRYHPELASKVDAKGRYPMHIAASSGCLKLVSRLYDLCAISLVSRDLRGFCPIHIAVYHNDAEMVERLHDSGAFISSHLDADEKTLPSLLRELPEEKKQRLYTGHTTPLELAIMLGHVKCETVLRTRLALFQADDIIHPHIHI